ncbi:hypothetical protein AGMMS49944_04210 [Spirochaetia bacterium]|nr:hypothetical protein AGMMS49944_04210 [Spirochaetia bacterium]
MQVKRFDEMDLSKWMTTPFKKTDDGFLTGRAIVTSCGVFTYRRLDGTLQSELRLPEDVFNEESLKSMMNKPLTNGHPNGLVTPETAHELQVGSLGSNPSSWVDTYAMTNPRDSGRGSSGSDGIHVANDLMITDGETILEVENGKRSLSMGYTCDIEESAGVWAGVEYNAIQRNIRYNHCAIVPTARAGDAAMIHLDSADAVLVDNKSEPIGGSKMKKINLDGVEYEGEEKLVESYVLQTKRADAAEAELAKVRSDSDASQKAAVSAMEADRDNHKDRADAAEAKLKELEAKHLDSKQLDALVLARTELLSNAAKAGVEVKADMAEVDVKKAIVTALYPKANFDGRDEIYIQARYDAAIEKLDEEDLAGDRQVLGGGSPPCWRGSHGQRRCAGQDDRGSQSPEQGHREGGQVIGSLRKSEKGHSGQCARSPSGHRDPPCRSEDLSRRSAVRSGGRCGGGIPSCADGGQGYRFCPGSCQHRVYHDQRHCR